MSIGDIYLAKEPSQTYQPLLLCEFTLSDGTVKRYSTHPLSDRYGGTPTAGSYEYGGNTWAPKVVNQDVGSTQAMSDLGIDIPPQVTVVLADPSHSEYQNLELAKGFKGAVLKLYAVMFDAGDTTTGSFSSNNPAPIKFIGVCGPANSDQENITITATSLLNFTQKQMPPARIQQICGWNFPPDQVSRADASTNPFSIFKECGYAFGEPSGIGNPDPSTGSAYQQCSFNFSACVARLGNSGNFPSIQFDQYGNRTGRFGGFQFTPPAYSGRQRPYTTGKWEDIVNAGTEAKYGDFMPLCYGETWTNPLVMGIWGDGNYTNLEVAICAGQINRIHTVLVNGINVSRIYPDTDAGYRPSDNSIASDTSTSTFKNGYWKTINDGRAAGQPNPNPGWGKQGDPYGSTAAIYISVLRAVASENSVPTVAILLDGVSVDVFSDPVTSTSQFSRSPVWVLRDVLLKAGWSDQYINLQSFIDAAVVCSTTISFDSMNGAYQNFYNESGSPSFERFSVGFSVRSRVTFGDLIRGVRSAMRAILYFDFNTGKLTLKIKQTLADQQPSAVTGSNYNVAVSSIDAAGVAANGYAAYNFDGASILKDAQGKSTFNISQKSNQESPNKVTLQFLNRENSYNSDSLTVVDIEDVNRVGSEVVGSVPVVGVQSFDHAKRILNCWLAEGYRGNSRLDFLGSAIGDTGGTLIFSFTTTVKALHLGVGDLCLITDLQSGITSQLFRILRIKPSTNFETAQIVGVFHNDNWYQDTYGQSAQPIYARAQRLAARAPFSWRPGYLQPLPSDAYYGSTELGFAVLPQYAYAADGSAIVTLQTTARLPINSFSTALGKPKLEIVGIGASGGGYPSSESFYVSLAEKEDTTTASLMSPVSEPVMVSTSAGQNKLNFVVQAWNPNPSGWVAFVGLDPAAMSYQEDGTSSPSSISLSGTYNRASWTPPDQMFSKFVWEVRKVEHGGVAGATISSVTTASMSLFTPYGFGVNQFAGHEVSVYGLDPNAVGRNGGQLPIPIANFSIASNTSATLVVSQNPTQAILPDGQGGYGHGDELSLLAGDVVVIRIKATFGQDSTGYYFEDSNWVNALNYLGTPFAILSVYAVNPNPVVLTIYVPPNVTFPVADGDYVVVRNIGTVPESTRWQVASVNTVAGTFELVGMSASDVVVGSQPVVYRQIVGLSTNGERGRLAFVISGTGQGTFAVISSNTSTRCYIVGSWPVSPDSTTRIIICDSTPLHTYPGDGLSNPERLVAICAKLDVKNYAGQSLLVHARSSTADGVLSSIVLDPFREVYLLGQAAFGAGSNAYYTIIPVNGHATIDFANGLLQRIVLNGTPVTVDGPIFTGGSLTDGLRFTLLLDQDSTGSRAIPTFASGAGGYPSDVALWQIDGTLSTRTTYQFILRGQWALESAPPVTGGPIT